MLSCLYLASLQGIILVKKELLERILEILKAYYAHPYLGDLEDINHAGKGPCR